MVRTAEERKAYAKEYYRNRYANDPEYREKGKQQAIRWRRDNPEKIQHTKKNQIARTKPLLTNWLETYKTAKGCAACGKTFGASSLDFHHQDPATKRIRLGSARTAPYALATIIAEAEKCQVLCANCHAVHHFQQRGGHTRKTPKKQRVQDWVWETKRGAGCSRCSEYRPETLDFHHVDPTTKLFGLSKAVEHTLLAVQEETRKCVLLCRNCHRAEHFPTQQLRETI